MIEKNTNLSEQAGQAAPENVDSHRVGPGALQTPKEVDAIIARGIAEYQWIYNEMATGRLSCYHGQHIAVVNQAVVASDSDLVRLNERLRDDFQLDPAQTITTYIDSLD
jgi:hypothetical protein